MHQQHRELVERQLWEDRERRRRGDSEEVRRQRAAAFMRRAEREGQIEGRRKEKKGKDCVIM